MKNSKLRRVLLLLACAVMLVSLSVGATLAYLTGTDSVKNTFTVGNVKIILDEKDVDGSQDGVTTAGRDQKNAYHLQPGHKYVKDPMVTVKANSENCYVRMRVTVGGYANLATAFPEEKYPTFWNNGMFNLHMVVEGWEDDNWAFYGYDATKNEYEFRYTSIVTKAGEDQPLDALFDKFVLPDDMTNKEIAALAQVEINVVADAIQSDGFDASEDGTKTAMQVAWEAFATADKDE